MLTFLIDSIAYMDKFARKFSEALSAAAVSGAYLARLLDVDASNIYHWKKGLRPIPADKAPVIAREIGVRPEEISQAYQEVQQASTSPSLTHSDGMVALSGKQRLTSDESQTQRFDPEMIAESYAALSEIYMEELGRPYDLTAEPERFVLVYEARSRMTKNPSASDERRFGAKVAEIVRLTGAELHGSRDGVPAEGDDKGPVARGVQRKKG